MSTHGADSVERFLVKLLVPVCILSGVVVVSAFFFPDFVGDVVSGRAWLVVALLFFGSALSYLSLLPADTDATLEPEDRYDAQYLLRVRRLSLLTTTRSFVGRQDPIGFWIPVAGLGAFFIAKLLAPATTLDAIDLVQGVVFEQFGWVFVTSISLAVVFCGYLLIGPWGDVKLGGPDAEPTYTYPVYFTMFFTAGIAAGIVFWGPAEALFHYQSPPPYFGVEPQSDAAIGAALTYTLFHWGFSAWSAYIVLGLPIAYYVYQRGAPLRVAAILTPFLGVDNLDSAWGKLVDVLAIFATIGGIATSVAFVSQQFLTGINYQWGVTYGVMGPVLFVAGLTAIFVISAQSGVHRGIRRIAVVNVLLFALFAVLIFALGPRAGIVDNAATAVTGYAVNFVPLSLHLGDGWVAGWTVYNWSWWLSWAPFAGLFLAALSKGRRVRTVVLTGFVATSIATIVWFLLLGGTALQLQHGGTADVLGSIEAHGGSEAVAGFPLFDALALGPLLMFLFLALIIVFMTTSADTSTLVVSILATKREFAPTTGTIVFWGVFQGAVAIVVLITGSAEALQAAAVLTGGPFAIIAIVALVGLSGTFLRHERARPTLLDAVRSRVAERKGKK